MIRIFGDEEIVTEEIAEIPQGIGMPPVKVQEQGTSSPTRIINTTIGTFTTKIPQDPTGLGDAGKIIVEFGVGGSTTGNEFTMQASGIVGPNAESLGVEYRFRIAVRLSRSGAPGVSILLLRFMHAPDGIFANGFQVSGSFSVEIDDPDTTWREIFDVNFTPAIGSISWIELARDEAGDNSGGLNANQPTGTLLAWNEVASARYEIIKQTLA